MNITWEKIKDGFNGFEKLAVEFVKENEPQNGCEWTPTKKTRDGNHDAILSKEVLEKPKPEFALFVGYANNADVWWMEAKYSADAYKKNKMISRYRLDATIVSAILSCSISKIIFVTNLEITSKTIADIREALLCSNSCNEVKFYTKSHLENWLLDKPYSFFKSRFDCSFDIYQKFERPPFNCIEELSFYTIGNNFFQEPLSSVYTGVIYEIHFSISVQKDFDATLNSSVNIQMLSEDAKNLHLKKGINNFIFTVCIPENLKYEPVLEKDMQGEYKTIQPLSITYILKDENGSTNFQMQIIPATAIKIINSANMFFDIPSQNEVVQQLCDELSNYRKNPDCIFSLISIYGSSGIGKSYVLHLFKSKLMKEKRTIICSAYAFYGDKIDDIKVLKKIVFHLFFPYLFFEDLDPDYVNELQNQFPNIKNAFWDFVFFSTEIEDFIKYIQNPKLLAEIFPNNIGINNRIIILDDIHKVPTEYKSILKEMLRILIKHDYPIFCIITSHQKISIEKYRSGKKSFFNSIELKVTKGDICTLLNSININIDIASITTLFGSVIELLYFMKYLTMLDDSIKNINDFTLAYHSFMQCELLKNEIVAKFKNTFGENADAEALCSCIYYTVSGIPQKLLYDVPHSAEVLDLLLDAELIRKNNDDSFVCWHDYYREIYINHFPLIPYTGLRIPFEDVYHTKLQLELKSRENDTIEDVITKIQCLFDEQKYYSIYYILENIFLTESAKRQFKSSISTKNYFLLFAYFAYANTNAGTIYYGYDIFDSLYTEAVSVADHTVIVIRYIVLWEMINSLYENDKYQNALIKINCFDKMPTTVQNDWKPLFGWDLQSLKYAVNTVKMFIDSENGINCLNNVPQKEFLFQKDIPFSTYRLLLCNLTNDYHTAEKILKEYNIIVQDRMDCDAKTKYMYNFAVTFLDCIKDNADISEVITANDLLKENFINDYNRHIFAISLLALSKGEISLCEQYRLEYLKTQRPMKARQQAFEAAYSALVYLFKYQKEDALIELKKEEELLSGKETYLPIIRHNIKYISEYEPSLDNLEFYLGAPLQDGKCYIDIRMLY